MKKKTKKHKKSASKRKKQLKRIGLALGLLALIAVGAGWYFLFSAMNATGETQYVYIDQDDNIDSVYTKVGAVSKGRCMTGFKLLAVSGKYADNIHKGRYAIDKSISAYRLYQKLKVGSFGTHVGCFGSPCEQEIGDGQCDALSRIVRSCYMPEI